MRSDVEYGDATITRGEDGWHVERADPVIGMSLELLAQAEVFVVDESGCILLAGDPRYRYRPARFATNPGDPTEAARMLVCERVS